MENEEEYISKEEAKKRGYVKRKEGGYYKMSVLEKYCAAGYLNLPDSPYTDEDRMRAGLRLAKDYYLGNFNNLQSVKLFLVRISSSRESGREAALFFNERYLKAVRAVPPEFWQAVRTVCVEDKELTVAKEVKQGTLLYKQCSYHRKMLLCLGLERLVKFYFQKNQKKT